MERLSLYVSVGLIIISFLLQIFARSFFVKYAQRIFWISIGTIAASLTYTTGLIYFSWLTTAGAARFFLPPYQDISYFIFFVGVRVWLPYLLSLAFSGIAFLGTKYLNRRFEERFFYPEERYLISLGVFFSVHPLWIAFLMLSGIFYLLYTLLKTFRAQSLVRNSFYYCWLPASLTTLLIVPYLPNSIVHTFKL